MVHENSTTNMLLYCCRICFSFCILADVLWYFASFEVRSSYFKHLGISLWFLYLMIVVYIYFGIRLVDINWMLKLGLPSVISQAGYSSVFNALLLVRFSGRSHRNQCRQRLATVATFFSELCFSGTGNI